VCRACEGQSRNAPLRRATILGGQKLAVSTFHGEVALAAERKAADTDERAEGILVFSGESEGITEDDEDAYEAHGEEEWVRTLSWMFGAAEWPSSPSHELSIGCSDGGAVRTKPAKPLAIK
jgi:hypothetical protein